MLSIYKGGFSGNRGRQGDPALCLKKLLVLGELLNHTRNILTLAALTK